MSQRAAGIRLRLFLLVREGEDCRSAGVLLQLSERRIVQTIMEKGPQGRFGRKSERFVVQTAAEESCSEGCSSLNDQSFRELQESIRSSGFVDSLNDQSFRELQERFRSNSFADCLNEKSFRQLFSGWQGRVWQQRGRAQPVGQAWNLALHTLHIPARLLH